MAVVVHGNQLEETSDDDTPTVHGPVVLHNTEMQIYRGRRDSHPRQRRASLAELIPDWPCLERTEKPEFRMPEVMWIVKIMLSCWHKELTVIHILSYKLYFPFHRHSYFTITYLSSERSYLCTIYFYCLSSLFLVLFFGHGHHTPSGPDY